MIEFRIKIFKLFIKRRIKKLILFRNIEKIAWNKFNYATEKDLLNKHNKEFRSIDIQAIIDFEDKYHIKKLTHFFYIYFIKVDLKSPIFII